ncbi:MAG: DUF354 domain-containing protein [Promethearchaeota archaeon]
MIWFDVCEPKTVVMLRGLYDRLAKYDEIVVTARDFDSTFFLLDSWGIPYEKVGAHGGNTLLGKLEAYSDRLSGLVEFVKGKDVNYLFCLASPEALRVSFGLQIPNVVFNDEPRSVGVAKLSFPFVDDLIVPDCIPLEWFTGLGCEADKIHPFHGIDEVAWLSSFQPDPAPLDPLGVAPGEYIVARSEASTAQYHMGRIEAHETLLVDIIPPLLENHPGKKVLAHVRNRAQFDYLVDEFRGEIAEGRVVLRQNVDNLQQVLYHAALVITGGGTMVRESALLGVPSVEFLYSETYPQEQFLIDNGFPLKHERAIPAILDACEEFLAGGGRVDTREKVRNLENPLDVAENIYLERRRA